MCDGGSNIVYTCRCTCKHKFIFLLETLFHNIKRCVYSKVKNVKSIFLGVRRKFRSAKIPFGENSFGKNSVGGNSFGKKYGHDNRVYTSVVHISCTKLIYILDMINGSSPLLTKNT